MVIAFGGEVVASERFIDLVHDFNLLLSLGVRLVLVHGARPQIEAELAQRKMKSRYLQGIRITDRPTLNCVLAATGRIRTEIEALLSMGLPNSPMANAKIRVAGGNYITAKPAGVLKGTDMQYTGEVRKVDGSAIQQRLEAGEIVLLSALGYSPTGEIFNLTLEQVATQAAITLPAHKLIFLMESEGIHNKKGELLSELSTDQALKLLPARHLTADVKLYLPCAIRACQAGVARAHLISWQHEGALLNELFTRDGIGSMIAQQALYHVRTATIDDVGSILALIGPLEDAGILVRRSRERLEMEINHYWVAEHDQAIIGCAALYPYPKEKTGELACLAVHADFRNNGYGEGLLRAVEQRARKLKLARLFVLTTRTAHWFVERGFSKSPLERLPRARQSLYNYQRRSQILEKSL